MCRIEFGEPRPVRAFGNVRLLYQGPSNEDGAFIGGIEVAAQYSFTQRPSPWDGFGVIFNHTWVDTDAEFISPSSGVAFNVPGLSRKHHQRGDLLRDRTFLNDRIASANGSTRSRTSAHRRDSSHLLNCQVRTCSGTRRRDFRCLEERHRTRRRRMGPHGLLEDRHVRTPEVRSQRV